jgi:hypothetical protein
VKRLIRADHDAAVNGPHTAGITRNANRSICLNPRIDSAAQVDNAASVGTDLDMRKGIEFLCRKLRLDLGRDD